MSVRTRVASALVAAALLPWSGSAQGAGQGLPGGQGMPGRQGGPGMMGGPNQPERKVLAQFDKDKDKRLDADERREARLWLESQPGMGPGGRCCGGFGRGGENATPTAGARLKPSDVRAYGKEPLYDPSILRTLFFQFENDEWEKELMAFNNTDVEVPATLIVDGKTYKDVGLHFRGASSFFGVPEVMKHSINVSLDFVHNQQDLLGYTTLNLLNSHEDPTYLRTLLFLQAAREYMPAPKANYMRVVLNGESWGVYVSAQQFNKGFVNEWFKTTEGARWKVPGSPQARGGLEYLGTDTAAYKRNYEIKSKDNDADWEAFILLCKTLNTTPADELERALSPMLDVDGTLRFLALEMALVNGDGYWTRASDYSIYRDPKGVFHIMPHDANETFGPGGGRGMGAPGRGPRGPGGPPNGGMQRGMPPPPDGGRGMRMGGPGFGGPDLDPLVGMNDTTKPLRSKLLAVPALRTRYLEYVRQVATRWLDWNTLGPLAQRYQALIADDVRKDTRKLDTFEAFESGVNGLKTFAERRRAFLLNAKAQ
jgi:spore coat protein CotH